MEYEYIRDQIKLCNMKKSILDDKTTLESLINLLIENGTITKKDIESCVDVIRDVDHYKIQYSTIRGEKEILNAMMDVLVADDTDTDTELGADEDAYLEDKEEKKEEHEKGHIKKNILKFFKFKKKSKINTFLLDNINIMSIGMKIKLKEKNNIDKFNSHLIIAVIGSTSLKNELLEVCKYIEMTGNIPVMTHVFSHADKYDNELDENDANFLNEMGQKRIDMADVVLIVSDGYIGDHTMLEVKYAKELEHPIFLYDINSLRYDGLHLEVYKNSLKKELAEVGVILDDYNILIEKH